MEEAKVVPEDKEAAAENKEDHISVDLESDEENANQLEFFDPAQENREKWRQNFIEKQRNNMTVNREEYMKGNAAVQSAVIMQLMPKKDDRRTQLMN